MKIRSSYVTNSSSSSYITLHLGNEVLKEFRDEADIDIDYLINELQKAKEKGIKCLEVFAELEYRG